MMQPLGRKAVRFPFKEDCHPKKPYANWWEVECANGENKTADRQKAHKDIKQELADTYPNS